MDLALTGPAGGRAALIQIHRLHRRLFDLMCRAEGFKPEIVKSRSLRYLRAFRAA